MGAHLLELAAIPTRPRRDGKGDADLRLSVLHGLRAITNAGRGGVGRPLCGITAALCALQGNAPLSPAIVTLAKGEGADLLVLLGVKRGLFAVPGGWLLPGRTILRRGEPLQVCGEVPLLLD